MARSPKNSPRFPFGRGALPPGEESENHLAIGHETLRRTLNQIQDKLQFHQVACQRFRALGRIRLGEPWAKFRDPSDGDRVLARTQVQDQVALS